MAGQSIERREALRLLGIAAVAAGFPGFRQWAFAGTEAATAPGASATPLPYRPLFFRADRYRMVELLAELIIPEDDTPGARQAGVAEFIDFMVANRVPVSGSGRSEPPRDSALGMGSELQRQWLEGLEWLDARCRYDHGREFMACETGQQLALLSALAYKSSYTPETAGGREFFRLVRDYAVAGYYTSRVGLEALGFPGLRTAWDKPPGCPHHDDPEHRKLRPVA
jgi:gluconate 2-dehydrogenase gamma chain